MKKLFLILLCAGLLLYIFSLVLFAKMHFDEGFGVLLAASALLIISAFPGVRLWLDKRRQKQNGKN